MFRSHRQFYCCKILFIIWKVFLDYVQRGALLNIGVKTHNDLLPAIFWFSYFACKQIGRTRRQSYLQLLKYRPIPASFCLFSFFSNSNDNLNNTNWKKRRWCAWDSNPGPQDGRRRWNHWAMAAQLLTTSLSLNSKPGLNPLK